MTRTHLVTIAASAALMIGSLLPVSASALQTGHPPAKSTRSCVEGSTMRVSTEIGTFVYTCQGGKWICTGLETGAAVGMMFYRAQ